jgi:hypothetical protein
MNHKEAEYESVDRIHLAQEGASSGLSEHSNVPQLVKKDSALWSWLVKTIQIYHNFIV